MAGLLAYCSAELADNAKVTVAKAKEFLPWMPECYRLYDVLSEAENWQDLPSVGFSRAEGAGRETLFAVGGHARSARRRRHDRQAACRREGAVGGPARRVQAEGVAWGTNSPSGAKLIAALLAVRQAPAAAEPGAAEPSDRGEPSWAALVRLIREVSFLQSWEQMRTHYGDDEFLAQIAPLVADHPYAALINSHVSNEAQRKAALEELTQVDTVGEGLEIPGASFGERVFRFRRSRMAQARQPVVRQDRTRPLRPGADEQKLSAMTASRPPAGWWRSVRTHPLRRPY